MKANTHGQANEAAAQARDMALADARAKASKAVDGQVDVFAETARRVKAGGPWTSADPDSTYARNSGTKR